METSSPEPSFLRGVCTPPAPGTAQNRPADELSFCVKVTLCSKLSRPCLARPAGAAAVPTLLPRRAQSPRCHAPE